MKKLDKACNGLKMSRFVRALMGIDFLTKENMSLLIDRTDTDIYEKGGKVTDIEIDYREQRVKLIDYDTTGAVITLKQQ